MYVAVGCSQTMQYIKKLVVPRIVCVPMQTICISTKQAVIVLINKATMQLRIQENIIPDFS